MDENKQEEFRVLAMALIEFLKENCHPHCTVILDLNRAELLEGMVAVSPRSIARSKIRLVEKDGD